MADHAGASRVARRHAERAARRRRRIRRTLIAFLVAIAVVGGAFGAGALLRDDEPPRAAPTTTTTTVAPTTTTVAAVPTTIPRDPRRGSGQPVTFAFGGDTHFEGGLRTKLRDDPAGMLGPVAPVLSSVDIAMVNLETAITERGTAADKEFTFRTPAAAMLALGAAGVDVVTIANNHGIDYGPDGLADTLLVKGTVPAPAIVGIGANAAEAFTPYRVEIRGQRIAIFGATDVLDGNVIDAWTATDAQAGLASAKDPARLVAAVQAARLDSDTIVVFLHWGAEGETCANERQKELAQTLVDAGADIIVGSHSHRVEGGGRLGTAFVAYGLGNYIWYNESGPSGESGTLLVTATGRDIDAYSWAPAVIRGGVPEPTPPGPDADAAVAEWNALRECAGLAP